MEIVLEFDSHENEKQKLAFQMWADDTTDNIVYGGSKGAGKSFLGCSIITSMCLTYDKTHYFIARKKLNDLRKFTIPSLHEVFTLFNLESKDYNYNGQDNYFEFFNGSKIFLIDAKYLPSDPMYERFGSMQMTGGWIEEAGEFEKDAKVNLFASIGRWMNKEYGIMGKLLETCNPKKNYLYSDFYKPFKEGTLPSNRGFIQALPQDNKMLPDGYIAHLEEILDAKAKERLLKGNWDYEDNPYSLLDYDSICNAFTNSFIQRTGTRYMSGDIAYLGADVFVITIWDGFVVVKTIVIDKIDETAIGNKFILLANEYSVPYSNIVYDADGLRKFTANSLSKLQGAKPFNNNSAPLIDKNYGNLKAECAFKLKEMFESNLIYFECQEFRKQFIADLETIHREPMNDEGKIRLEKKSDHKKRTGKSPDFFDSLIMRMLFELKTNFGWG